MTYLTIEEINTNPKYAPLGYKEQFNKRIKEELSEIVKNLDVKKTLTPKRIGIYYNIIQTLLDPYNLEKIPELYYGMYYEPDFMENLESFAHWNDYPINWETRDCYYHRINLKTEILKEFDYYFKNLIHNSRDLETRFD